QNRGEVSALDIPPVPYSNYQVCRSSPVTRPPPRGTWTLRLPTRHYVKRREIFPTFSPKERHAQLPVELWIAIIDFVGEEADLSRLCQTSKFLQSIAGPQLYERHFIYTEQAKRMSIRSALVHSQFEFLINTLCLRLERWSVVSGSVVYCQSSIGHDSAKRLSRCSCDELDETLQATLPSLLNLKELRLNCCLCETKLYDEHRYERHQYFATLQTKMLQEVKFSCSCSFMDQKQLVKYFGAPCMATVTTLRWCVRGLYITPEYLKASFSNRNILPKLQSLYYEGSKLDDLLLQHRPIQRISSTNTYRVEMVPKHQDLVYRRHHLTHVSIQHQDTLRVLFKTIEKNPLSFRQLQHLGVLRLRPGTNTCLDQGEGLYVILSPLAGLERLASVEYSFNGHPTVIPCSGLSAPATDNNAWNTPPKPSPANIPADTANPYMSAKAHCDRVLELGDDECETDSVPVGEPVPVLLGYPEVLDDDCDSGEHAQSDRGVPRACGDRGITGKNTWRSLREEDKEAGGEEDGDGRAKELGGELVFGFGTEEVTGLEVARHVGGLSGCSSGESTSDQVDQLCLVDFHLREDTTEYDLGGFGAGTDGVDIGITGRLHTNEREDESKQERQNGLSTIKFISTISTKSINECLHSDVELGAHEGTRDDEGEEHAHDPPPCLDAIFEGSGVEVLLGYIVGVPDKDALERGTEVTSALEALPKVVTTRHGNLQGDIDTGPEQPVTGVDLNAHSQARLDDRRSNDGPRKYTPTQKAPTGINTRQHTRTKESGGKLENPAIVFELDSFGPSEPVERPPNVPVQKDTGDESVEGLPAETAKEVERADCEGGCGGGGEDEALADDKVGAEGNDEEHAKAHLPKSDLGLGERRPSRYMAGTAETKRIPSPPADVAATPVEGSALLIALMMEKPKMA
ncbi:3551_t:CDS:10, partial [Acaulospora colombiana]